MCSVSSSLPTENCSTLPNIDEASFAQKILDLKKKHKTLHKKPIKYPKLPLKPKYFTYGRVNEKTKKADTGVYFNPPKEELILLEWKYNVKKEIKRQEARNQLKCREKTNNRFALKQDLLSRLNVETSAKESDVWIKDLAPPFFAAIENRSIKERQSTKQYIQTCREVLRTKIVTGFKMDDINYLNNKLLSQKHIMKQIEKDVKTCWRANDAFLAVDQAKSMKLMEVSKECVHFRQDKEKELAELLVEYNKLKGQFYLYDETLKALKSYQWFLYITSPMEWQKANPLFNSKTLLRDSAMVTSPSAEDEVKNVIDNYNNFISTVTHFKLFFKHPKQLLDVVEQKKVRIFNTILNMSELDAKKANIEDATRFAEASFKKQEEELLYKMSELLDVVEFEEARATLLRNLTYKLLNNEFKEVVAGEDVLKFFVNVEDIFTQVVSKNFMEFKEIKLVEKLENLYLKQMSMLDQMPKQILLQEEVQFYEHESRQMRKALQAKNLLIQFDTLAAGLVKSLTPPYRKIGRELKPRSRPYDPPKPKPPKPREFTADEQRFLDYFTLYCTGDDSTKFGINRKQPPITEFPWTMEEEELF